ncbi:3-hydroxyisobutyrate dehydrogenase-like beta-hydroxyacid dehydrogenase [Haloactinospora alba]|uniref:3-hydroxyisobutyrate dehydrogenase-like beta-hydroxyacid dehydrogenase n=1 Tax=Haloactinospora alba TaxID=405555 RepID=A0A543NEP1_9ACTN|nr:NAD(P)-binding domain-containing protein [Haloactinospora alba]TQN30295.1 3-hydroxyisobutyrate dehydrogenase-like beta-hydroxyacid dehydrogenase [Haloactinospora alba]
MSDVTVVGTGAMGSRLATALLDAGLDVAVWNRTPERAFALREYGATPHESLSEATGASPVVVLTIPGYDAGHSVLSSVSPELRGRVVVQSACGTPDDVAGTERLVESAGAGYVEAVFLCYPEELGTGACNILYAGDESAFRRLSAVTEALGGATYLGGDTTLVNTYYALAITFYYAVVNGTIESASLARSRGLPLAAFNHAVRLALGNIDAVATDVAAHVHAGEHGDSLSPLSIHHETLESTAQLYTDHGIPDSLLHTMRDRAHAGVANGHGHSHISVLSEQRTDGAQAAARGAGEGDS